MSRRLLIRQQVFKENQVEKIPIYSQLVAEVIKLYLVFI